MAIAHPEVIVVGAGPVGLTLANLLGQYGLRTLVVERNAGPETEPRAVTLDDESLRTFQNAGLIDAVQKDVVLGYGVEYFAWNGKPFASIQPTLEEYGFPKRNAFRQPLLVRALLLGLKRYDHVDVRFDQELTSLATGGDGVSCTVRCGGDEQVLEAKWLVGCDGGRSKVRELCGIPMEGYSFPARWLIVDLAERTLPLRHTSTYCDPRRPAIRLPGPGGTLRYEFMLRPGDRDEDVLQERTFRAWIADRVPGDRDLPLVRKAIYGFNALIAQRWRNEAVLLAGDAAHLTPPFAGQGLNSGIRDASNLAWKLAAVQRWNVPARLIDSYEQERKPHAAALIRMAVRIGAFMQPHTVPGAIAAQAALRLACLVPAWRDYILQLRFKPRPRFTAGYFEQAHSELLPQPEVQVRDQGNVRLDTLLGDGFAILGWDTPAFTAGAQRLLPAGVPGCVLPLVRRDDDFLPGASSVAVRDVSGELGALLDRLCAAALVVRPDRYSYRVVDQRQLAAVRSPAPQRREKNRKIESVRDAL